MVESVRSLLDQADCCLEAAVQAAHCDPDAAVDDMLAARLLVATASFGLCVPLAQE